MPLNHKQKKMVSYLKLPNGYEGAVLEESSNLGRFVSIYCSIHSNFNHIDISSIPTEVRQIKVGNLLHLSNGMIVQQSYMSKTKKLKNRPMYVN